jgi:hypothetical protein
MSKFYNKKVLLTEGGTVLDEDHLKELKQAGIVLDGIHFDSMMECDFYVERLLPKVQSGEIEVILQPRYLLLPAFEKRGKKWQKMEYIADFEVRHKSGRVDVIDIKGLETDDFKIKRKLFEYTFPEHELLIIKRVKKFGGWVTEEEYNRLRRSEKKEKRGDAKPRNKIKRRSKRA